MNFKTLVTNRIQQVRDPDARGPTLLDAREVFAYPESRYAAVKLLAADIEKLDPAPDFYIGIGARGVELAALLGALADKGSSEARKNNISSGEVETKYINFIGKEETVAIHAELLKQLHNELLEKLCAESKPERPLRVILVDDRLGSGNTAEAAIKLLKYLKVEIVAVACIAHQPLGGKEKLFALGVTNILSVINYKAGQPGEYLDRDDNPDALKGSGGASLNMRREGQRALRRDSFSDFSALPPGARKHIGSGLQNHIFG